MTKRKPPYDGTTPLPDPQQELFCILYTSNATPRFFGHGQFSYAFAYDHQKRIDEIQALIVGPAKDRKKKSKLDLVAEQKRIEATCRACAARLLVAANIRLRCNFLMDSLFKDEIMDRELLYVLEQRHDLQSKMRAWEMAAKLRMRIRDKVDIKHEFEPIDGIDYMLPTAPAGAPRKR